MLIAQLFLVVSVAVATADVIADTDTPVQISPAEFQAVNCGNKLCKNGAKCINGTTCECPNGTKGDECEVVIGCAKLKEKCDRINTECIYKPNTEAATCKCKDEKQQFNGETCVDCNCGEFGTSCSFSDRGKHCYCKKGYSNKLGTCSPCTCGPKTTGCSFATGEKYCICEEGYHFKLGTCEKCDCGANSTSCFFVEAAKRCICKDGNVDKLGTCTHCDCVGNTTCIFTNTGEKDCLCTEESCREPAIFENAPMRIVTDFPRSQIN